MAGIGKTWEEDPNAYANIGRGIVDAMKGVVTSPGGEAGLLTEAGRTYDYPLSETAKGNIPPVVSTPTGIPNITPSAAVSNVPVPSETPLVKSHPLAKYKNGYEALHDLTDEKFKKFVDNHPNIPGIGYVTPGKGTTGKLQRIIENPEDKPPEPQMMTLKQAEVMGHFLGGVGSREQAHQLMLSREDIARENRIARQEVAANVQGIKKDEDFARLESSVGAVPDISGKPTVNPLLAMHVLDQQGYPESAIPQSRFPILKEARRRFADYLNAQVNDPQRKNKGQPLTPTEKARLAKQFENELRGPRFPGLQQ